LQLAVAKERSWLFAIGKEKKKCAVGFGFAKIKLNDKIFSC
jgi:hypothetical protein